MSDRKLSGTYQMYGNAVDAALEVSKFGELIVQEVGPNESAHTHVHFDADNRIMHIISRGDFATSRKDGKTKFTFRMP